MTSFIRRDTFVVQDSSMRAPPLEPPTGINHQNVMRLKINRIALVQDLRVEHVTGMLLNVGVIDGEDVMKINSGTTPQDKTRLLLNLLPTKSKSTEWYKHFRESLQNPDAGPEIRRRYKLLVSFLDNTAVRRPACKVSSFRDRYIPGTQELMLLPRNKEQSNKAKFPYYSTLPDIKHTDALKKEELNSVQKADSPKITNECVRNEESEHTEGNNGRLNKMRLVQRQFLHWFPIPENFRSLIDIPKGHCQRLLTSDNPEDQELMAKEEMALEKLRRVEVVATLTRQNLLPSGFELCLCDGVKDLLRQPKLYHMYLKHFVTLEAAGVMLVREICSSYEAVLQTEKSYSTSEIVNRATQTGLMLANLLIAVNKFSDAGSILASTIQFLQQSANIESWIPRYHGYINLMQTWNLACQPDKAELAYFEAVQMQYQITMMSFGQNVVHDGAWHAETSFMMLEHGSVASALGWAKRALKEVDPENPASVVRVLCVAINSYCANWLVRKAELLAIYVVQYARSQFGERHPMFLEALLYLCHFSSEFKKDPVALQASKELLDAAEKTYGCESIQVALAHRSISKALMSLHLLDTDDYYTHAREALCISQAALGQNSPLLHNFLHTFASALHVKALQVPQEAADSALLWAEAVAKQALGLVAEMFGEISLKSAQMLLLLGQIYSKMCRVDVAEKCLKQAVDYLKLCQPSSSYYLLKGMADLASFYKIVLKPDLAIPLFQFVVDHIESTGWYIKWVHMCFEDLAQLYGFLGQDNKAEAIQVKLSHWLKANPQTSNPIDYSCLKEEPEPFKTFVAKADLWGKIVHKLITVPLETAAYSEGQVK